MAVLPATAIKWMFARDTPHRSHRICSASLMPSTMSRLSCFRPSGFSTWWMRASTSGPTAIWGLSNTDSPMCAPVERSMMRNTTRVVPRSTARPQRVSALSGAARWTRMPLPLPSLNSTAVARKFHSRSRAGSCFKRARSMWTVRTPSDFCNTAASRSASAVLSPKEGGGRVTFFTQRLSCVMVSFKGSGFRVQGSGFGFRVQGCFFR